MELVNSVDEVIDRLGGNSVVAKRLGVTANAVGNWRGGRIPARHFIALSGLLKEHGLSAPASLWRMQVLEEQ